MSLDFTPVVILAVIGAIFLIGLAFYGAWVLMGWGGIFLLAIIFIILVMLDC